MLDIVFGLFTLGVVMLYFYHRAGQAIKRIPERQPPHDGWDFRARLCGNCTYWPLNGYYAARFSEGMGKPSGCGGPNTDGSLSDCRAALPGTYHVVGYADTRWPQTKRDDFCAAFEQRDYNKLG